MAPYRYAHFQRELMKDHAGLGGPGPGDMLPHFNLTTIDGSCVRPEDFRGCNFFITFSSVA